MALNVATLTDRWGDIFGGVNEANTFIGTTVAARADNIYANYASLAAQRDVVDDLYENTVSVKDNMAAWSEALYALVAATLQAQCRDDTARPKTDDIEGWFGKLNLDMLASNLTLAQPSTLTGTVASDSNNDGDGYLLCCMNEPSDAYVQANADPTCKGLYFSLAEVIRIECTADSFDGGATAGNESFSVSGETAVELRDYNWPKGSGASTSITAVSPDSSAVLTDGGLEVWAGTGNNTPTNWTVVGTAGTHVLRGSSSPYDGNYFCTFTGDGATTVGLYQDITETVEPNTNYAVQFWVKVPGANLLDETGTQTELRVSLRDGSGNVLTDNLGTSQQSFAAGTAASGAYTAASTQLNATYLNDLIAWTRVSLILRTPRSLPTETRLDFRFVTQALDNGQSVYIDHIVMEPMTQVYPGGPYIALISGATEFANTDKFTLTVANSAGTSSFIGNLQRTFDLAGSGLRIICDGSATYADSKITDD